MHVVEGGRHRLRPTRPADEGAGRRRDGDRHALERRRRGSSLSSADPDLHRLELEHPQTVTLSAPARRRRRGPAAVDRSARVVDSSDRRRRTPRRRRQPEGQRRRARRRLGRRARRRAERQRRSSPTAQPGTLHDPADEGADRAGHGPHPRRRQDARLLERPALPRSVGSVRADSHLRRRRTGSTPITITVASNPRTCRPRVRASRSRSSRRSRTRPPGIFGPLIIEGNSTAPRALVQGVQLPTRDRRRRCRSLASPPTQRRDQDRHAERLRRRQPVGDTGHLGAISTAEFANLLELALRRQPRMAASSASQFGEIDGLDMGGR